MLDGRTYRYYIKCMEIHFDPAKDVLNRKKHGVSLAFAAELEWSYALAVVDDRFEYEEIRLRALVPKDSRLYYVAFTEHEDGYRIISLRAATKQETRHYVSDYQGRS